MIEEIGRQFILSGFLPHGYCINWSPPLVATYVISDLIIFFSYFSMPVAIGYFARRRPDFPHKWVLWMFAAFILACGTTHLLGTLVLWQPVYWLDASLKAVTALISLATAVALWPLIPRVLQVPGAAELQAVNDELRKEIAERQRIEKELKASHDFYHDIANNGHALIWMAGTDKRCFYFNRPWLEFTGRSLDEELGNGWAEGVHPDDHERCLRIYSQAFDRRERFSMAYRLRRHDGEYRWVLDDGLPRYDREGNFTGYVGHCLDITELQQAEDALQIYANAFRHSGEAIMITDRDNRIVEVNPAFTLHTGYTLDDLRGKDPKVLSAGRTEREAYQDMWKSLTTGGYWQGELWDRRKDGSCYPKWVAISVIRDPLGNVSHYIAGFSDISERKANEEQIRQLAHHDPLTGLLNRFSLESRMEQALACARRECARLAVMFIDMDRFKIINDTLGHHAGDELLVQVAQRLRSSVRESDIVARLGGDEFIIVLTGIESHGTVASIAGKILGTLGEPYRIASGEFNSTPSIGISVFPDDGLDAQTLMKNADAAMYSAKDAGRNTYRFFTAAMTADAEQRL